MTPPFDLHHHRRPLYQYLSPRPILIAAFLFVLSIANLPHCSAADWPQYRGLSRNGATTEQIAAFPAGSPPSELWHTNVGKGHSPVSIAAGRAVTLGCIPATAEDKPGTDTVWCLNALTGKMIWRHDYSALTRLKKEPGNGEYDGPHAAPAIVGNRVYTLSRDGQVHCLSFASGTLLWKRNLAADYQMKYPECGFAGSPLVTGGMVIVSVGRAGTALDAKTGQTRWRSEPEIAGYSAPGLVRDANGHRRLVFFAFKELLSVNPADGKPQWSFSWPTAWGANVADPVPIADALFISSCYNRGCALVDLKSGKPRWQNKLLKSQASPMILHDKVIYGFDGYINDTMANQSLICMDPLTGKEFWRKKGMGGQMILAGDKLIMLLVSGELVIVRATSRGYQELSRARIQDKEECPIPPSLVAGRLYCRTGKGQLRCLSFSPEQSK